MSLQNDLLNYEFNTQAYSVVFLEFVAISLIVWAMSSSFLIAVLFFIGIQFAFLMPYVKHIIAWLLIIAWCVGSYLLGHAYFSMPTTIGMVILTFFFMAAVHFGALDL